MKNRQIGREPRGGARRATRLCLGAGVLLTAGCSRLDRDVDDATATAFWDARTSAPDVDIRVVRRDTSWRLAPSVDSIFRIDTAVVRAADSVRQLRLDTIPFPETFADLGRLAPPPERPEAAVRDTTGDAAQGDAAPGDPTPGTDAEDVVGAIRVPLAGEIAGPSVMYAQALLDLSGFSPGTIDGAWGKNTEQALFWFQRANALPPTGRLDSLSLQRLYRAAGQPSRLRATHVVTSADLEGPFESIPADVYDQAPLDCMCYESPAEAVAERAHATRDLLAELNPDVTLDALAVGDTLTVPAVGEFAERPDRASMAARDSTGAIAEIVVSGAGGYVQARSGDGRIVMHAPATLGSRYHPSPSDTLRVTDVREDPWFHYQPRLLAGVDDTEPDTRLPPGPNNPVGVVWIALSKEHYGIHGTARPETIGYTTSSGCVRLTNWDAKTLSERIEPGVRVRFVDIEPGAEGSPPGS